MMDDPSDDDTTSVATRTVGSTSDTTAKDDDENVGVDDEVETNKWQLLTTLVKLNDSELDKLKKAGYTNASDLELLGMNATDTLRMLRGTQYKFPLAKVQRLEVFAAYLFNKGPIGPSTTIHDMRQYNVNLSKGSESPPSSDHEGVGLQKSDVSNVPKYPNDTTKFDEYWDRLVGYLMATPLGHYLEHKPTTQGTPKTRRTARNRNSAPHWHLYHAFLHTDGDNVVRDAGQKYDASGYHTAQALLNHFRSADQRAEVQRRIRNEISKLTYDGLRDDVPTAQSYINKFKLLMQRLEQAKEIWDDTKKKAEFLKGLQPETGTPSSMVKTMLRRNDTKTYDASVRDVLATANDEEVEAEEVQHAKARRAPAISTHEAKLPTIMASNNTPDLCPLIPDHVVGEMRKARDAQAAVSILLKWRKVNNTERRTIRPDELSGGGKPNSKFDNKRKRNAKRKRRTQKSTTAVEVDTSINESRPKRATRRTKQSTFGPPREEVTATIEDDDRDKTITWTDSDSDDKGSQIGNNKNDPKNPTNDRGNKKRRRKRTRRLPKFRHQGRRDHRLVLDTGTDLEIIGCAAWNVIHRYQDRTESVEGALVGMTGTRDMPVVAAVAAAIPSATAPPS